MCKILETDKLKNRDETRNMLNFQGFEGKFPQFLPECKNILHFNLRTQNMHIQSKNEAINLMTQYQ